MSDAEQNGRVVVEDPEHMNLLGLLMQGLLSTNLANPAIARKVGSLRGDVRVQAGEMAVTLRFSDGPLRILRETETRPKAGVCGSMPALLGVVAGKGLVGPVLSRAIRIQGNPFVLLKMLPLIRAPQ